ncbi:tetratricopeptide repeat protein [Candidatus Uabimicrobium sp. HlEnr_7]|uniref:tetratricopeptide repeat protein n=1 Tax=Candidatus Uabimicrobium helgolandensis TaxID=3095367 RepID=UPI0035580C67
MYIRLIFVIFIFGFFPTFNFGQNENISSKEKLILQKLNEAHQLMLGKKTDEAITILKKLADTEQEAKLLYAIHGMLGDAYSSKFDVDQANKHYDRLLDIKPNDGYIYFKKGQILKFFPKKIKEAIECFEASKKYGFENAGIHTALGFCYKMAAERSSSKADVEKFYFMAIESYKKLLGLEPGNRIALGNLGDICFNIGSYDVAEKIYSELHQRFPNDIETNVRLGHTFLVKKQYQKAEKILKKTNALFEGLDVKSNQQLFNKKLEADLYYAEVLIAVKKASQAKQILSNVIVLGDSIESLSSTTKYRLQQAKKLLQNIK